MCINTDCKKYPRRHSMSSSRPPRPSKNIEESTPMMIDSYETEQVDFLIESQRSQRGQRRLRKSVSFDEVVMVRPVIPLAEFTDQEIINSWYLPVEKQRMRAEIMNILKVIKEKNKNSKKQFNVRGLEWLAQKDKVRERARKASINEILQEQANQRANASESEDAIMYDSLRFRKVYRRHSKSAMHTAVAMGKIDAMEVETASKPSMMVRGHSSMMSLGKKGNNSFSSNGNDSWSDSWKSNSTRSTRSTSTRSSGERSISTKATGSKKTRRGSRRFSLA